MMRAVKEWIGNDDQAIPARVKLRVFDRCDGRCIECTLPIAGKLSAQYDHIVGLCNGGANAEHNLQLLCVPCHQEKTKADVAEKSKVNRVRQKHLGIAPPRKKIQSRGFAKAAPQRSASRPIERRS